MQTLSNFLEKPMQELYAKHGAFYAFSQQQFEEKRKPDTKYTQVATGLLVPKTNVEQFINEFDEIHRAAVAADVESNGAEGIIRREYFNYETQITGDNDHLKEQLESYFEKFPEKFTLALFSSVCRQCYAEAVENDWF